jgi:glycosyltransferase involved in cell wall biosynthesis
MISIILPLYNERENVLHYNQDFFPIIEKISRKTGEKFSFIFVDDGSKDDTVTQLENVARNRSDITILKHGINRGMGNAIKTGLAACSSELVVTMDSDLTFRPEDVDKLIEKFRETNADCVSGSPYMGSGLMEEVTPFRLFLSASVNFMYRCLLGKKITSVSPIFRLYKRDELAKLSITSNNFEINAEIISKLLIAGKNVVEIPVPLLRRKYGYSKINVRKEIKNNLLMLYKIFKTKYLHRDWN